MKKLLYTCLLLAAVVAVAVFALPTEANAATEGDYTYTISNGKATITDVNTSISGNVTVPSTLGGLPGHCHWQLCIRGLQQPD